MRHLRCLAWSLPIALGLVAGALCGLATHVVAAPEDLIEFRYPGDGWAAIATGSSESYAVNPEMPTHNAVGADIWLAVDTAVTAWNDTRRWNGGGTNYLYKNPL